MAAITAELENLDAPPAALKLYLWERGPKEVERRKGFWRCNEFIGRGFEFGVSLLDIDEQVTCSEGVLIAALRQSWCTIAVQDVGGCEPMESGRRGAETARQDRTYTVWSQEFAVRRDSFRWATLENMRGIQSRVLLFSYKQVKPLVFVNKNTSDNGVFLHVWFIRPDGKYIYNNGARLPWR